MDSSFCVSALERILVRGRPEIFNRAIRAAKFTSRAFTSVLRLPRCVSAWTGHRRAYDNIFVERLWRTVKYEEVYLHDYQTVAEAVYGLRRYFSFYNDSWPHQSLGYHTASGGVRGSGDGTPPR